MMEYYSMIIQMILGGSPREKFLWAQPQLGQNHQKGSQVGGTTCWSEFKVWECHGRKTEARGRDKADGEATDCSR